MSEQWVTQDALNKGYVRILPIGGKPVAAIDILEVDDLRCGCDVFAVMLWRPEVFPIVCECSVCGATWMRALP